jgi:hypothetical protein
MTGFEGFTDDALEFYDGLMADNSKTYRPDPPTPGFPCRRGMLSPSTGCSLCSARYPMPAWETSDAAAPRRKNDSLSMGCAPCWV